MNLVGRGKIMSNLIENVSICGDLPPHSCGRCRNFVSMSPFRGICQVDDKMRHRRELMPIECEDYEDGENDE